MSQHYFFTTHANQPVCVILGWDRPIGHYFMVIERDASAEGADDEPTDEVAGTGEIVYSNLNEPDAFQLTLDHFKSRLAALGLAVPAPMFEQVEHDRACDVGNRHVWYDADGSFRQL